MANLVENVWLTRYHRSKEIMYDQGSEFIGHELRKYLIGEEYGIISKPSTLVNPTSSEVL